LENSISIVREGLLRTERETHKSMAQRILAVREQELERTKALQRLSVAAMLQTPRGCCVFALAEAADDL
jgi:hypothetical protein